MSAIESAPQVKPTQTNPQPPITVGIVTYNGRQILQPCIDSLLAQTYPNVQICVINNASTDGTPEWVQQNYPSVNVINNPDNRGPNPARNAAITTASTDLVLLVDDDAILSENCLAELVKAAQSHPEGAIWAPRIVYSDRRDTIQFEGAKMHYLAETILVSSDTPIKDGVSDITQVAMLAGVTLLVSKQKAEDIGLFNEFYFFGKEDGEFTYRLTQAGEKLYTVPNAICYHRVKKRGLAKVFYQVRNRWLLLLTTFSLKTILLTAPALIIYELSLIGFLTLKGKLPEYLQALFDLIIHAPTILKRRKEIQSARRVPDKALIHYDNISIRGDLVKNKALAALKSSLDSFFGFYWKLIHRFI